MGEKKQTTKKNNPALTLVLLVLAVFAMLAALWYYSGSALPVNGEDVGSVSAAQPEDETPATPAPTPSPSSTTNVGRKILAEHPHCCPRPCSPTRLRPHWTRFWTRSRALCRCGCRI